MEEIYVVLVDENDNETGVMEKIEAHRKALLHRAVSVFLFDSDGNWILQKRAMDKYHSRGLWTNTCCTHPAPGESDIDSASRRLQEEMGIKCSIRKIFSFVYREKLDNDLTEHEFDHVFTGIFDGEPLINESEVDDWKRISFSELEKDIEINPQNYTYWFKQIYRRVQEHFNDSK